MPPCMQGCSEQSELRNTLLRSTLRNLPAIFALILKNFLDTRRVHKD